MKRAAIALAASLAFGCTRPAYDVASSDARAMHEGGAHAIPFPPRATVHPARAPVVVVEPLLWKRELLLRDGGLVAWLEDEGYPVWLVGPDADGAIDERALAASIARVVTRVAVETRAARVDVIALALAGPATMDALDALTRDVESVHLGKIVFLGAPLDRAYDREPLAARLASLRDPASRAWLSASAIETPGDARPARERFPFAARFTSLPALFVAGKVDGVAPSESVFPAYALWGDGERDARRVPKVFFLAGRENELARDADAFALLDGSKTATRLWERVAAFLE